MSETFTTDFEEETIDPTIDWPESMEPGIYFGLPEADYHADKALSNSGIKNMMISPLDYWARSWMNPAYEEEEKPHFKIGKAWHKRLLEGSDAFYEEYAVALDKADYPEALVTSDDIKAKLKELGEKMTGKKADQIERLVAIDPSIEIWDVLVENHAEVNDGKILLEPDIVATVEAQASMIEGHPDISRCFTNDRRQPRCAVVITRTDSGCRQLWCLCFCAAARAPKLGCTQPLGARRQTSPLRHTSTRPSSC